MMKFWNRVAYRLERGMDWVKNRTLPNHKLHLVNTGLEPGYYDPDQRMLHACFALLIYHVEQEVGGLDKLDAWTTSMVAKPDPNAPDGLQERQVEAQSETSKLYRWWTIDRPAREARQEELTHDLYERPWGLHKLETPHEVAGIQVTEGYGPLEPPREGDKEKREELHEIMSREYSEDNEMLKRLIDIRGSLWI